MFAWCVSKKNPVFDAEYCGPSQHPYGREGQTSYGTTTSSGRNKRGGQPKSPQKSRPSARKRIYFYNAKDPHYGFTNFSPHPIEYRGKVYPTSEHLFQSFKFQDRRPLLAEHIRTCSDKPSVALSEARRFQREVRPDWMKVHVTKMDETLLLKFRQHPSLKKELLETGDAELIEDSDKDSFWGVGADRKGRNELGKALVRLRSKFRAGY